MTLGSSDNQIIYVGNGVTTTFSYPRLFQADGDLVVKLIDSEGNPTTQTITTNYTVSGSGNAKGGFVEMITAPDTDEKLSIERVVSINQTEDLTDGVDFPADEIEEFYDKSTMIAQQIQEKVNRMPKLKVTSSGSNLSLEDLTSNSGKVVIINDTEDGFSYVPLTASTVGDAGDKDLFSGDGATTEFTLSFTAGDVNSLLVVVDNVLKEPTVDYTVSGTTLTFITAPNSGTDNIYVINFNARLSLNVPSDDSITNTKLKTDAAETAKFVDRACTNLKFADDSVTTAKISSGVLTNVKFLDGAFSSGKLNKTLISNQTDEVILAGDEIMFSDTDDSGNLKKDTIQGVLNLDTSSIWNLIEEQNASNSTDIQFTSNIDSTYRRYIVMLSNILPTTYNREFDMTVSTDGGSTYLAGTNYKYHVSKLNSSLSSYAAVASAGASAIKIGGGLDNSHTYSAMISIDNPSNSSVYKNISILGAYRTSSGNTDLTVNSATVTTTSAIDAIKFAINSGNINSGNFKLYGIK